MPVASTIFPAKHKLPAYAAAPEGGDDRPQVAKVRKSIEREVDFDKQVQQFSGEVAKGVRGALQRTMDTAITAPVTLFLLFYSMRDKYRILRVLDQLVPPSPSENEQVRDSIRNTLAAVVFGTLSVAVVQGTLGGLMFWWLDLPAPILWGAVMAILAILRLFGAALIWIPAAAYLAIASARNAMAESFFATLECELLDRRSWKSKAEVTDRRRG